MAESLEREIEGLRSLFRSERDPQGRAFVPLADAYRRNRDLDRALELISAGLEQHPDFASAHVVSAWIHRDRGDRDTARAAWERVLELDEENVEALRGLGTLLLESGRMQEARPYLEKARSLDPEDPDVPGFVAGVEPERPAVALAAAPAQAGEETLEGFGVVSVAEGSAFASDEDSDDEPTLRLAESLSASVERRLREVAAPEIAADPVEDAGDLETAAPAEVEPVIEGEAFAVVVAGTAWAGPPTEAERMAADEAEPGPLPDLAIQEAAVQEAVAQEEPPREAEAEEAGPVVEETVVVAAGGASPRPASEIMEVWSEHGLEEEEESGGAELPATRTMAELFARQGLVERAAGVYERLVAERPGDAGLRARLEELRAQLGSTPGAGVHDDDTEAIARSWTAVDEEPTHSPFGWAPQEASADETERVGEPISSYFSRLLAWEPGIVGEQGVLVETDVVTGPAVAPEPEILAEPLAEPVAGAEPAALDRPVVPIESLAPDQPVPAGRPDPARAVPITSLAPDAVPIESLAPDAEPPHLGSTIQF